MPKTKSRGKRIRVNSFEENVILFFMAPIVDELEKRSESIPVFFRQSHLRDHFDFLSYRLMSHLNFFASSKAYPKSLKKELERIKERIAAIILLHKKLDDSFLETLSSLAKDIRKTILAIVEIKKP